MPQELPPNQISAVATQVLKTWWFWLCLIVVVWAGLFAVERVTRFESRRFQAELEQNASNQLAGSLTVISNKLRVQIATAASNELRRSFADITNQIAAALAQPQLRSTISAVASRQATQLLASAISPALSNFQARLAIAQGRLDSATNLLARQSPGSSAPTPAATPAQSATPAGIIFDTQSITRQGADYVLTVMLRKTGDGPLGALRFAVGAFNQLPARILAVDVACDAAPSIERAIASGGLEAVIGFTPAPGVDPAFKILLSGPTVTQITSDALPDPLTIPVLVNLPGAGANTNQ